MEILKLLNRLNEFDYYDKFSISSDHSCIAYVKRQKPPDFHFQDLTDSNGTPFSNVGSELWLSHIDSGKSRLINEKNSWRPSWSSDNTRIVFYSDKNGFPQLWMFSITENKVEVLCEHKVKSLFSALDKACWSFDNKKIYFPEVSHSNRKNENDFKDLKEINVKIFKSPIFNNETSTAISIEELCVINIIEFDLETRKTKKLVSKDHSSKPAFISASPVGNYLGYISSLTPGTSSEHYYTQLWILKLNEHSIHFIDNDLSIHPILKNLPFLWTPNENKIIYLKNGKLLLVDLLNDFSKKIIFESEKYKLSEKIFQINNYKKIIISVDDENWDLTKKLIIIDYDHLNICQIINMDDFPEYTTILDAIITNNNLIIITQNYNSLETVHLAYDLTKITEENFNKKLNKSNVIHNHYCYLNTLTPAGDFQVLGYYENIHQNGEIALFDDKLNIKKLITHINKPLKALPNYTIKVIKTVIITKSEKKHDVNTVILIPEKFNGSTIIDLYPGNIPSEYIGKFSASLTSSVFPRALYLQNGFALILPDMPLIYEEVENLLDEFMSLLIPQIENISIQVKEININKLGLIGQSFGGYAVAGIISKSAFFKAAVAMNGLYDLIGSYGYIDKHGYFLQRRLIEGGQFSMGHAPWENLQHYINNSPYYLADKMNTPLLLIHGEMDDTCPSVESEKLFTALDRLGKTVELAIYSKEEHSPFMWQEKNYIDVGNRVIDFFSKYLNNP